MCYIGKVYPSTQSYTTCPTCSKTVHGLNFVDHRTGMKQPNFLSKTISHCVGISHCIGIRPLPNQQPFPFV